MSIVATLNAAADLIDRGWCRGYAALNRYGVECDPDSDSAVCWCVIGAVEAVESNSDRREDALVAIGDIVDRDIAEWNDAPDRTQAEASAMLRRAALARVAP